MTDEEIEKIVTKLNKRIEKRFKYLEKLANKQCVVLKSLEVHQEELINNRTLIEGFLFRFKHSALDAIIKAEEEIDGEALPGLSSDPETEKIIQSVLRRYDQRFKALDRLIEKVWNEIDWVRHRNEQMMMTDTFARTLFFKYRDVLLEAIETAEAEVEEN